MSLREVGQRREWNAAAPCCSMAVTAILWALARILNATNPKRGGVGLGEIGGQFVGHGIDGLTESLSEILDLGIRLGRQEFGHHVWTPVTPPGLPTSSPN